MSDKTRKILTIILSIILIVAVVVLGYQIIQRQMTQDKYEEVVEEVVEEEVVEEEVVEEEEEINTIENPIDFETLQERNSDIYAWIRIDDTQIDYPVLQYADTDNLYDEFYLEHDLDGVSAIAGAIFSQKVNTTTFEDNNTVLYGHNMKNGSMFKGLHEYEDEEYMKEHQTVTIYTPEKVFTYQVFAASVMSNDHLFAAYTYDFGEGTETYLNDIIENAVAIDSDVEVSAEDHFLSLSTCTGDSSTRLIVVAKLVDTQVCE